MRGRVLGRVTGCQPSVFFSVDARELPAVCDLERCLLILSRSAGQESEQAQLRFPDRVSVSRNEGVG